MLADSIVFVDRDTPPRLLDAARRLQRRAFVIAADETVLRQGGANDEEMVDVPRREERP